MIGFSDKFAKRYKHSLKGTEKITLSNDAKPIENIKLLLDLSVNYLIIKYSKICTIN